MTKPGDGRRVARVENEVRESIAQYLLRGIQSELPGLVTVSRVQMPADLKTARVYITLIVPHGQDEAAAQEEAVEILQERAPEIQHQLNQDLALRFCPRLEFFPDRSVEKILAVEGTLKKLRENRRPGEGQNE